MLVHLEEFQSSASTSWWSDDSDFWDDDSDFWDDEGKSNGIGGAGLAGVAAAERPVNVHICALESHLKLSR